MNVRCWKWKNMIKSPDSFFPFLFSCVVTSSPRMQMDFLTVSTSLARSDAFTLSRVSWASCCSLFSQRGAKNGPFSSDVGSKIATDVIIEKESRRFLVERRNKLSVSCSVAQNFNRCSQLRSAKMNRYWPRLLMFNWSELILVVIFTFFWWWFVSFMRLWSHQSERWDFARCGRLFNEINMISPDVRQVANTLHIFIADCLDVDVVQCGPWGLLKGITTETEIASKYDVWI